MPKPKVIVYSTEWCPWCHRVKDWLKEHKITFEDRDVENTPGAGEEMMKKSGQTGIPVTDIGGTIIIGFDIEALKKALKLKE